MSGNIRSEARIDEMYHVINDLISDRRRRSVWRSVDGCIEIDCYSVPTRRWRCQTSSSRRSGRALRATLTCVWLLPLSRGILVERHAGKRGWQCVRSGRCESACGALRWRGAATQSVAAGAGAGAGAGGPDGVSSSRNCEIKVRKGFQDTLSYTGWVK